MKNIFTTVMAFALSSNAFALSDLELRQKMVTNLETIKSVYQGSYAPLGWKATFANWDLETEIEAAKNEVFNRQSISVDDYQLILRDFILSMKDYHVSVRFFSTEKATLPLQIVEGEGRFFIGYIDREALPTSTFSFSVGDEVIEFDGRPVVEVVEEMVAGMGGNTAETDRELATYFLTKRSGKSGISVPSGPINLVFKRKGTTENVAHQLVWMYDPELFDTDALVRGVFETESLANTPTAPSLKDHLELEMYWGDRDLIGEFDDLSGDNPHTIGGKKTFTPPLGVKVWSAEESDKFDAYVFKLDQKLVGYVRIPSYSAGVAESQEFQAVLARMDGITDALVIDQVNNPGGSVFYLYSLVSMLTDHAVATPQHHIALDSHTVANVLGMLKDVEAIETTEDAQKAFGKTVGGYPVDLSFAKMVLNYCRFLQTEWQAGKTLSDPVHLWGVDQINPSTAVQYTKPTLLLVNPLDFSGGDFFPAILQDNGLVRVMGTRTAGAGGYVQRVTFFNELGLDNFSVTGSLAKRVNQNPIENLGVTPDVNYVLSANDRQNGYVEYVAAIHNELRTMLAPKEEPSDDKEPEEAEEEEHDGWLPFPWKDWR